MSVPFWPCFGAISGAPTGGSQTFSLGNYEGKSHVVRRGRLLVIFPISICRRLSVRGVWSSREQRIWRSCRCWRTTKKRRSFAWSGLRLLMARLRPMSHNDKQQKLSSSTQLATASHGRVNIYIPSAKDANKSAVRLYCLTFFMLKYMLFVCQISIPYGWNNSLTITRVAQVSTVAWSPTGWEAYFFFVNIWPRQRWRYPHRWSWVDTVETSDFLVQIWSRFRRGRVAVLGRSVRFGPSGLGFLFTFVLSARFQIKRQFQLENTLPIWLHQELGINHAGRSKKWKAVHPLSKKFASYPYFFWSFFLFPRWWQMSLMHLIWRVGREWCMRSGTHGSHSKWDTNLINCLFSLRTVF